MSAGHVVVDAEVFARLAGRYPERDTLLFEVAALFLDDAEDNAWSNPVRFRFVRREGAHVELEMHRLRDEELVPQEEDAA